MRDRGAGGPPPARSSVVALAVPAVVSTVVAAVVLGPALGRGVVLAYDLAWSPDPRLTPFTLGTSTPAPRAVPSDAAGVALGWLLGAGPGPGARALGDPGARRCRGRPAGPPPRPGLGAAAGSVAAVAAIWNPFVLERLVVGQWTVLLGYAAVPHLMVACVRVRRGRAPVWAPAVGLAACGVGGANTLVIGALTVGGVLARPTPTVGGARSRRRLDARRVGGLGAPGGHRRCGVLRPRGRGRSPPAPTPRSGCSARSSAVGRSGTRPRTRHPARCSSAPWRRSCWRSSPWSSPPARPGVNGSLPWWCRRCVGLALAWLSALDPFGVWTFLVVHVPGGGVLRDAQKLVAPWVVLAAAGAGVLVRDLVRVRAGRPGPGRARRRSCPWCSCRRSPGASVAGSPRSRCPTDLRSRRHPLSDGAVRARGSPARGRSTAATAGTATACR